MKGGLVGVEGQAVLAGGGEHDVQGDLVGVYVRCREEDVVGKSMQRCIVAFEGGGHVTEAAAAAGGLPLLPLQAWRSKKELQLLATAFQRVY